MADNVSNASVANDIIAADEISGVKYQRIKLAVGTDGEYIGDVSTETPLPSVVCNTFYPLLNTVSVTGNNSVIGIVDTAVGSSYKIAIVGTTLTTGVVNVDVLVSDDNVAWEIYYQNKYGISSPNFRISLPSLPIANKFIRCVVTPLVDVSLEATCINLGMAVNPYRQRIFTNLQFSDVDDVTPSFIVTDLKILNAIVSEVPVGIIGYKWELSLDGNEWLSASALILTSTTGITCNIANNYGYSFARLRVIHSTASANPVSITLQGLV